MIYLQDSYETQNALIEQSLVVNMYNQLLATAAFFASFSCGMRLMMSE